MVTVSSTTGEQVLDDPLVGALETVDWLGAGDLDTGTVEWNHLGLSTSWTVLGVPTPQ